MNVVDFIAQTVETRDQLISGSKHGIYPFSKYREHNDGNALYFDDSNPEKGVDGSVRYPVVWDYLVDDQHFDIISTYGIDDDEYKLTVRAVKFEENDDYEIEASVEARRPDALFDNIFYYISNGECQVEDC